MSTAQPLKVGMFKLFHNTLYWACDYLFMLGLKSIHISKVKWDLAAVNTHLFLLYFVSYEAFQDTPSIDRLVSSTNYSFSSVSASMPH